MKTLIKNGNIVTQSNIFKADILVENGIITEIGYGIPSKDAKIFNAEDNFILPGGVDMHTQLALGAQGNFSSTAFRKNTIAALYGGVTTLIEEVMPVQESLEPLEYYKNALEHNSFVDYSFHQLCQVPFSQEKLQALVENTLRGFPSCTLSTFGKMRMSDDDIAELLHVHSSCGGTSFIQCESHTPSKLLEELFTLKGKTSSYGIAAAHPVWSEKEAFDRMCNLARAGGMAFCVEHVSSKEIVEKLYRQRSEGLPITCTTSPLHLAFTENKYRSYQDNDENGYKYLIIPPLRKEEDIQALWKGIADGCIHFVTTRHNSIHLKHKLAISEGNVFKCSLGAPSIELRLPLLFTEGVHKNKIDMIKLAEITASYATRIGGLRNKGRIETGTDGDIVILNPNMEKKIKLEELHENCDYSPYEGMILKGFPQYVFLRGKLVIDNYKCIAQEAQGQLVFRKAIAVR